MTTQRSQSKTLLLVLLGVAGLGCVATTAIVALVFGTLSNFGDGDQDWSSTAVAERDLPQLFGVKLPAKPLDWHSRAMGFQDGLWEVLVKLPPSSAATFVSMNKLEVDELTDAPDTSALEYLMTVDPALPPLKARRLRLPDTATQADGGKWYLYRSGTLLEGEGVFWLHLVAHET